MSCRSPQPSDWLFQAHCRPSRILLGYPQRDRSGQLHMMFKLSECAQPKWRRLRVSDYLAKVVSGIKFTD